MTQRAGSTNHWHSSAVPPAARAEAWQEVLNRTHLPWTLSHRVSRQFAAGLAWRRLQETSLVACTCDPCGGFRTRSHARRSELDCYGVLFLRGGRESVEHAGTAVELTAGSIFIWDSTQPLRFEVRSRISKVTAFVPKLLLERAVPHRSSLRARRLDGTRGEGALLAAHVDALSRVMGEIGDARAGDLEQGMLELLTLALDADAPAPPAARRLLTQQRIDGYIRRNLRDHRLTPTRIARELGISPRYLHLLFAERRETVAAFIRRLRLEAIARDLCNPALDDHTLTEIAHARGFQDAAHFSRAFRKAYDRSPREFRRARGAGGPEE